MKPMTFRQGIVAMPRFFDANVGSDLDAVIQFNVTGDEPGVWTFRLKEGRCTVEDGAGDRPADLTVETPSDVWLRIMRGELNGVEAFLSGQATATGDVDLLFMLKPLFKFEPAKPRP